MKSKDKVVNKEDLRRLIQPIIKQEINDYVEKEIKDYVATKIVDEGFIRFNDWSYYDEG